MTLTFVAEWIDASLLWLPRHVMWQPHYGVFIPSYECDIRRFVRTRYRRTVQYNKYGSTEYGVHSGNVVYSYTAVEHVLVRTVRV